MLRAFRRAYQSLRLSGNIVAVDIDPLAPALRVADRPYLVPRFSTAEYIPALAHICERERVNLLFPLIDPEIPILARHREILEATGARLAVCSTEAIETITDKWRTAHFFREKQIPAPQSWLPEHLDSQKLTYPLFIKPRFGSAAQHTFKVTNAQELEFFSQYVPDPIIQEHLPGPEITNDVICDLQGEVLGVVSRRRIEVRWGEVAKGVTVYDPAITAACVKIARALPATGPITVQCMMKDGAPYFTEINARYGGGVPLGIAAGVDSPRWLLARAAGLPVEIPPLGAYRQGLYLTRFDDAFHLTEDDLAKIPGHSL